MREIINVVAVGFVVGNFIIGILFAFYLGGCFVAWQWLHISASTIRLVLLGAYSGSIAFVVRNTDDEMPRMLTIKKK